MRENVVLLLGRVREAIQLIVRSITELGLAVELSCPTDGEIRRVRTWSHALCKVADEGLADTRLDLLPVERAVLLKLCETTTMQQSVVANRGTLSESDPNFFEDVNRLDRVFYVEMPEAMRRLEAAIGLPLSDDAWVIDQIGEQRKRHVTISDVAKFAHLEASSMTCYVKAWGEPVVTKSGRRKAQYDLEVIRSILKSQFPDAKPIDWQKLESAAKSV